MCSLYYFDETIAYDITRLTGEAVSFTSLGDIHPSDQSPVIIGRDHFLHANEMRWGFLGHDKKQLMINARGESALTKKSFSESVLRRRCIIPAKHFYEWDADKNKVTFTCKDSPVLYMAGFYNLFENQDRFIILTTSANDSMKKSMTGCRSSFLKTT